MKRATHLIYRYLTNAEFFNINKPAGTEAKGGGQTYIDFPTTNISVPEWNEFLANVRGISQTIRANGPAWHCPVHSIGVSTEKSSQSVIIYQRRPNSICIGAQKITSQTGNRIEAWHPSNGFPEPADPTDRHQLPPGLVVYLIRTDDDEIWAGWFQNATSSVRATRTVETENALTEMISGRHEGDAGLLRFDRGRLLTIDASDSSAPFVSLTALRESSPTKMGTPKVNEGQIASNKRYVAINHSKQTATKTKSEKELVEALFAEDENATATAEEIQKLVKIRIRNRNAIKDLKELYGHSCQITGVKYSFKKKDGSYYTEAHHIVPLGIGGADNPHNIIIVSPLIHRMLHYAMVSNIDLTHMIKLEDGSSYLDIVINEKTYRVRWHKEHAKRVIAASTKTAI